MIRHRFTAAALLAAGVALVFACSDSVTPFDPPVPDVDAGIDAEAGPPVGNFGDAGDAGCLQKCSDDLLSITDCHDATVETCAPNLACGPDVKCVSACDAVKARKGSTGCEFYVHRPAGLYEGCFAAFVVNTWNTPVTITGEAGPNPVNLTQSAFLPHGTGTAITYDPLPSGKIPPGELAIVFLSDDPNGITVCPKTPAAVGGPATWKDGIDQTGKSGSVLKLKTDLPVAAFDIFPYGGGKSEITSATLLLPTSTWGDNYIAVTPFPFGENTFGPGLAVVADEDDTEVTFVAPVKIWGGKNVDASAPNTPITYKLNKGDLQYMAQLEDLVGSVVSSTKPIGMWAEQICFQADESACDGAHQQIPPIKALGSEYVGVRYRNRVDGKNESPPWRVIGVVDNTRLAWYPTAPPDAPATLNTGETYVFRPSDPFLVTSQDSDHPFYLNAYMTGGGDNGCDVVNDAKCFGRRGDPEFVNVIPTKQYPHEYTFFTDPTYPETNLVFVRAKGKDDTFKDVTLDCAGKLTGWQPIGTSDRFEYTRFDLSRHNYQGQGTCNNGRQHAISEAPFGLTVWAWGTEETGEYTDPGYSLYVSYAYPAGATVDSVNEVKIPPVPR